MLRPLLKQYSPLHVRAPAHTQNVAASAHTQNDISSRKNTAASQQHSFFPIHLPNRGTVLASSEPNCRPIALLHSPAPIPTTAPIQRAVCPCRLPSSVGLQGRGELPPYRVGAGEASICRRARKACERASGAELHQQVSGCSGRPELWVWGGSGRLQGI